MVKVVELHILCPNRENILNETEAAFETGRWKISEDRLQQPGSIRVGLHQERTQESYLQGRLTEFQPYGDRVMLQVNKTSQPLVWRGGGSGKIGFLYSGAKDVEHLPRVPIDMSKILTPGKNESIRGLYESENWSYPSENNLQPDRPAQNQKLQAWFVNQIVKISVAIGSRELPYAFIDAKGWPYRLDNRRLRHAIANGVLENYRADPDGRVRKFKFSQTYWQEKRSFRKTCAQHIVVPPDEG